MKKQKSEISSNDTLLKTLRAAVDEYQAGETALDADERTFASAQEKYKEFGPRIDLRDAGQLTEAAQLRTIIDLAPAKIEASEVALFGKREALLNLTNEYIGSVLAPRVQDLEARALVKLEAKLKESFPDEDALRRAALGTTELRALEPIKRQALKRVFSRNADVVGYASEIVETAAAADEFEKIYLGQN